MMALSGAECREGCLEEGTLQVSLGGWKLKSMFMEQGFRVQRVIGLECQTEA